MKNDKKILLAGGKGFLGRALQHYFQEKGCDVRVLTRDPKRSNEIYWDGENLDRKSVV